MVFANVPAEKAYELIKENEDSDNFVILDVRTPKEFNEGHIKNAILINIYERDFKDKISELDRKKTYLIYCRTGNRSYHAMHLMAQLGFHEVYNLADGIVEWKFEVVR